jgi:hypothetical protein
MAPARESTPAAVPASSDALTGAVERLCDELRILREVMDDIREDFSWVTRNGLPVQPIEHVHVKRMALDPCASDWRERLEIERSTCPANGSASPLDVEMLDRIAETLTTTVEAVAQGQLEAVVNALDVVRNEILSALDHEEGEPHDPPAVAASSLPSVQPPPEKRPRDSLF